MRTMLAEMSLPYARKVDFSIFKSRQNHFSSLYCLKNSSMLHRSDLEALRSEHKFVRSAEEDSRDGADWKVRLARRYYDKLYKEYAIIDLSRHELGLIGLRWRTEAEVIARKGDTFCATKRCDGGSPLSEFEVPFLYEEKGEVKLELVKVKLCTSCSAKFVLYKEKDRKRKSGSSSSLSRDHKRRKGSA